MRAKRSPKRPETAANAPASPVLGLRLRLGLGLRLGIRLVGAVLLIIIGRVGGIVDTDGRKQLLHESHRPPPDLADAGVEVGHHRAERGRAAELLRWRT